MFCECASINNYIINNNLRSFNRNITTYTNILFFIENNQISFNEILKLCGVSRHQKSKQFVVYGSKSLVIVVKTDHRTTSCQWLIHNSQDIARRKENNLSSSHVLKFARRLTRKCKHLATWRDHWSLPIGEWTQQ